MFSPSSLRPGLRTLLSFSAALTLGGLSGGCAPAIPRVSHGLAPTAPAPTSAPPLEACLLVGERREGRQAEAIADLSLARWQVGLSSLLVRHPSKGWVLIDPAFGQSIVSDLARAPLWFKLVMGSSRHKVPVGELLMRAGVDPYDVRYALLTHAHWDHAGGVQDLPRATVLLSEAERAFVKSLRGHLDHGAMRHHLSLPDARFAPFRWDGPPYESFDVSHDVFGDGSIVAVPLHGHTPGSVGYFLHLNGGQRWLLIGDLAFSLEGVRRPVHKSGPARAFADGDVARTGETLGRLHALMNARPDLRILPAHDLGAAAGLPECAPGAAPAALSPAP